MKHQENNPDSLNITQVVFIVYPGKQKELPEFFLEVLHGERKICIGGNMSPNTLIVAFTDKLVYAMPIQKPHRSEAERYSVAVPKL